MFCSHVVNVNRVDKGKHSGHLATQQQKSYPMANILPNRFSSFREHRGLTQSEMGNLLGITGKYVGMIERGEKDVDDESSLGLLFRIQEEKSANDQPVSKAERASNSKQEEDPVEYSRIRMIPVTGWAHAGEAESYEEIPEAWKGKIPTECRDLKAFGVRLEGDSMEPKYTEGDWLVVQPSEQAHSGCLVVAKFLHDGVIFRRFEITGKIVTLVPLNRRYQPSQHSLEDFAWIYPVWGRWTQVWRK